ncbi:hypothetical protein [Propionispora sp. 2/2-37]|uniref:hypothetical protein n=1 Tax=Propionispora sp. 2/2-37 TaxID=1677858 RepID=UPI0006BB7748|nr:hypothetical protein [Propionispora sp. 2/2-37]
MRLFISPLKKAAAALAAFLPQPSIGGIAVVLKSILHQAFDQYVFDRVNDILLTAGTADAKYGKAATEVRNTLSQLMELAHKLEGQHPELFDLIMDFESGLAAEIAYRQGLRGSGTVRREFSSFIQEQYDFSEKPALPADGNVNASVRQADNAE